MFCKRVPAVTSMSVKSEIWNVLSPNSDKEICLAVKNLFHSCRSKSLLPSMSNISTSLSEWWTSCKIISKITKNSVMDPRANLCITDANFHCLSKLICRYTGTAATTAYQGRWAYTQLEKTNSKFRLIMALIERSATLPQLRSMCLKLDSASGNLPRSFCWTRLSLSIATHAISCRSRNPGGHHWLIAWFERARSHFPATAIAKMDHSPVWNFLLAAG